MLLEDLEKKKLIHPPRWLANNTHYLCLMGSHCYGCNEVDSDWDIYGFCTPKKEMIFPHLVGEIPGFGKQIEKFEQYQEHKIIDHTAHSGKGQEYDFQIFSIVKYFQLLMECNPNIVNTAFVDRVYIIHSSAIGNMVRENRHMFLHKGCKVKFSGYAFSQLHKMNNHSNNQYVQDIRAFEEQNGIDHKTTYAQALSGENLGNIDIERYREIYRNGMNESKRFESRKIHNFDLKYAMHLVRLLGECQQILTNHDLDMLANKEHLKAIRRGEVSKDDILKWTSEKEQCLERLYETSTLRNKPDEEKIKVLLFNCLEHHFGSLDKCIIIPNKQEQILREIIKLASSVLGENHGCDRNIH